MKSSKSELRCILNLNAEFLAEYSAGFIARELREERTRRICLVHRPCFFVEEVKQVEGEKAYYKIDGHENEWIKDS